MLTVEHINKQYNIVTLDDISFEISKNDFFVVFGPDNSGKTELLSMITGMHRFNEGRIFYQEDDIRHLKREKYSTIRYVPDDIIMEDKITAKQYLEHILKSYKITDNSMLLQLIKYFQIDVDEKLIEMTYEGNKLTTIIGALITYPELLILDEPYNFLTDKGTEKLNTLLKKMNEHGLTVLIATEFFEDCEGLCNRFVYLKNGTIISKCKIRQKVNNFKAITIKAGNWEKLEEYMGKPIGKNTNGNTYMFSNENANIYEILLKCNVKNDDFLIETIRLDEVLDRDFSRWE